MPLYEAGGLDTLYDELNTLITVDELKLLNNYMVVSQQV